MVCEEHAIRKSFAITVSLFAAFLFARATHADDLFDAIGNILKPVAEAPPVSEPTTEVPVIRAVEDVDPVDQLVGPRYSRAHRVLLDAQIAKMLAESDERRVDAIRELRKLVATEPDRFIWTNRDRWTSTRRLAREALQELQGNDGATSRENVAVNDLTFSDIARLALRSGSRSTSGRLLRSWASVRRDAGGTLLPSLRLGEAEKIRLPVVVDSEPVSADSPVTLAKWSRDSGSSRWNQLVSKIYQQRRTERQSIVSAFEPAVTEKLVIWRTARGLQAVDASLGRVVWNVSLPDSYVAAGQETGSRPSTLPFQLQGWRRGVPADSATEHELFAGGGRSRPVVDDQNVYVVIDPMARSPRLYVRRFNFQNRNNTPGTSSLNCNILRAIDLKTGRTRWEVGGESLQDSFDRPLAGSFFLGPPKSVGDFLYVLAERSGEITLLVLAADTGVLRWSQPLAATRNPIDQAPNRRFWSLSPVLQNGIAVCPSGIGWTFAIDVDGRELLWARRVVGPERRTNRFNFSQLSEVDHRWRSQPLLLNKGTVWTFPQESGGSDGVSSPQRGYCLDLLSGKPIFIVPRGTAILPIAVYSQDDRAASLILAEQDTLRMTKVNRSGENQQDVWECEIGPGRLISGRPLLVGDEIHVPVDGNQLWTISAVDGHIVKRRPYDGAGQLANLTMVNSRLLSCGPSSLVQLQSETSIRDQSPAVVANPSARLEQLSIARVTGNFREAMNSLEEWATTRAEVETTQRLLPEQQSQFFYLATATLTTALEEGLPASPNVLAAIESLAHSVGADIQVERYRILALIQEGQLAEAANRLVQMAANDTMDDVIVSCPDSIGDDRLPNRLVKLDRWLLATLSDVWSQLSSGEQLRIQAEIARQSIGTRTNELLVRLAPTHATFDEFRRRSASAGSNFVVKRTSSRYAAAMRAEIAFQLESDFLAGFFARLPWSSQVVPRPAWTDPLQPNVTGVGQGSGKLTVIPIVSSGLDSASGGGVSQSVLSDVQLVLNPSLKAAIVRSAGDGALLATLPLTDRAREVHDSRPHAWHDRDQLLIAHQGNLYVFRLMDWSLAWSHPLPPSTPFHRIGTDASFQFDRPRTLPDQRQPRETSIVAVGPDVIVIRNQASLIARDRTDGSRCWSRDTLPNESVVGHLRSSLVVRAGSDWRSIRFIDGKTRPIELSSPPRSAIATFDDMIVTAETDGYSGPVTLTGWQVADTGAVVTPEQLWERKVANDAAVGLLPPRVVAIIDQKDQVDLLDLSSGELKPTGEIPGLAVRSDARFYGVIYDDRLFVASYNEQAGDPFDAVGGQSLRVRGALAAIDLTAAKVAWSRAEQAGNFLWGYSRGTPIVLLYQRKRTLIDTIPITNFQFIALSSETGTTIVDVQRKLSDSHVSSVDYDPQEQAVSIRLMSSRLRLTPQE